MNLRRSKNSIKESTRVADQIRRQIYRGILNTGDKLLPEKDLVAYFGVSRPTLREALRLLESEGLILIQRGSGGVRVMQPNPESLVRLFGGFLQRQKANLEDIFTARLLIEPSAAYLLATHATRDVIRKMEENIRVSEEILKTSNNTSDYIFEFSEMLVENCGNRTVRLVCQLMQRLIKMQFVFNESDLTLSSDDARARAQMELDNRRELVGAVKERDSERAASAWRMHIERSSEYLLSAYSMQAQIDLGWESQSRGS